jgi:hypothetical protein
MRGKSKVIFNRMEEIEKFAGVDFWSDRVHSNGRIDWDKYRAAKEELASVNSEYKALRDEMNTLNNKKWAKQKAKKERTRKLWSELLPVLDLPSLTDNQKIALRVAHELLWQCKPTTVERAEKTARKEAAAQTPPFTWSGKEKANVS